MKNVCQNMLIFIPFFVVMSCDNLNERCDNMPKQIIGTGEIINWVLIPKIEDDFSVEFIVEHKRWKGK